MFSVPVFAPVTFLKPSRVVYSRWSVRTQLRFYCTLAFFFSVQYDLQAVIASRRFVEGSEVHHVDANTEVRCAVCAHSTVRYAYFTLRVFQPGKHSFPSYNMSLVSFRAMEGVLTNKPTTPVLPVCRACGTARICGVDRFLPLSPRSDGSCGRFSEGRMWRKLGERG
jgi:hypothetical protein